MKKWIPLLLALALLLSLSLTAFAEEGNSHTYTDPDSDSTTLDQTITTNIPDDKILWHLEIPATVTITAGGYEGRRDIGNVTIVLESGELTDKQKIEASLTYDGKMIGSTSADLNYMLSDKAAAFDGDNYATLETGKAHVVGTMTKTDTTYNAPNAWVGQGDWDLAPSGEYEGTIVYSSRLVETDV